MLAPLVPVPPTTTPLCTKDPDLWFSDNPADKEQAKDACFDCPLMLTCRERAPFEEFGIWGGEEGTYVPNRRALRAQEKTERNDRMYAMHRVGATHVEIAEEFRVSTKTVERALSDYRITENSTDTAASAA